MMNLTKWNEEYQQQGKAYKTKNMRNTKNITIDEEKKYIIKFMKTLPLDTLRKLINIINNLDTK